MPQSNPTITNSKSETFSQGMAQGDFIDAQMGNIFFVRKFFTIPPEFTSIEFIVHVRQISGGNTPIIYWFSDLAPGEDQVTWFDGNQINLPSAVGGPVPSGYPGVVKFGIGPSFAGVSTQKPTTDPINQPNFLQIFTTSGGINYINTTITTPIQLIFAMATDNPPSTPPSLLDATVYNTFYK